ncbi:hypothetical protein, partial [Klebsiella pneumoniae]|uniref:hypothetical protein n=1 Tax=Klebsiella pneumoniae TaxID=573 RepID=UPI001968301F
IIFSQDIRRPPRLFKNEGIGWALRHFRVSENDKKGTQMFLNVIVIVSPLKPTSSVFRRRKAHLLWFCGENDHSHFSPLYDPSR